MVLSELKLKYLLYLCLMVPTFTIVTGWVMKVKSVKSVNCMFLSNTVQIRSDGWFNRLVPTFSDVTDWVMKVMRVTRVNCMFYQIQFKFGLLNGSIKE
jgi:hypothetical protein